MMRLALLGDLHYHEIDESVTGLKEARRAFYQTVLEQFLEQEADLYISLGDLTNFGTASELREVYDLLRRQDKTFIHVLGNHDLYAQRRAEVLEITGQERYHAIDTDQAMLVFLDTAKEMDFKDWGGWLDPEQLGWLEEQVGLSGDKPLLVFGHHPVYNTTAGSEKDKGSIHPIIDMWSILNQKQGIGIYFNGHTHMDSIAHRQDWSFVQLSACLDQPGFRIVDIAEDAIRITPVEVMDPTLPDHMALLHRHMKHFSPNPDARGMEDDRALLVPLPIAPQI
ncbi:3',5'-cyclic AMP phosphodiesterase CpdA [Paenibacillus rhizosphaerae]|uniref:3',5'-cyclic AMP phosphodiesterase CpdA n=1 Tax=Paenibacillus rhizosphaerae TaxID=297318 RepID=A0A839TWX9_9BACL|nr:metallophosphoesterase [Paenibacillus rhizosphaerae]MBB3131001.1 3',5'-cyclic AMP phosphodiesterase CpdA [Paenibacillus rhizosphaerae]